MTSLKSTTALAMCAVLSFPQVSFGAEHAGLPMCGEAPEAQHAEEAAYRAYATTSNAAIRDASALQSLM